jgi:hypothetical protein
VIFRFSAILFLFLLFSVDLNIEGIGFTCTDGWLGNSGKCRMETDLYERSKSWL